MAAGLLLKVVGFCVWALFWLGGTATVSTTALAGGDAVVVDARSAVAATDDDFVCATLDWWPPDKCDYGTCSWGRATLLNLVSSASHHPLLLFFFFFGRQSDMVACPGSGRCCHAGHESRAAHMAAGEAPQAAGASPASRSPTLASVRFHAPSVTAARPEIAGASLARGGQQR